ncbi:hypothetical protein CEXT_412041 [Caerostris extrusa]|uniref:Uncharacterized protein n=1 Tax=Caerostris extrusa TaxID=172846 RepID=A0AAV4UIB1_CAEEX|nr:hypothetical protein CEXT_412041 [Caerostris extrusa]
MEFWEDARNGISCEQCGRVDEGDEVHGSRPYEIVTQLTPRTCHRNHQSNHHLAITRGHFSRKPVYPLSNTTLQTPSPERNLAISRARINTELSELRLDYTTEPSYVSDAHVIDTETNLSPSKERCLISGGLKIISSQIVTQFSPRTCHRNHQPNHHLALHGDTYPENTLSNSTLQTPSPERNLAISRARINTGLSELGLDYIKRAEVLIQVVLLSDQSNVSGIVMANSNKRYRRFPASDNHRSCSPCIFKNYCSTFIYPLLSSMFPTITYPVGTDASRKMGRECS